MSLQLPQTAQEWIEWLKNNWIWVLLIVVVIIILFLRPRRRRIIIE